MLLFSDMLYMLVRCESKRSYVDFIRPCRVVVFALFYCCLDFCVGIFT